MEGIKRFFSTIWSYWKKFGEFIGNVIGRIFLMLFYVTIVLPFGLLMRLFGDPLDIRDRAKRPRWRERTSPEATIEAAYNQF
ncbi:MAG TPA: hypothetical protein ENI95_06165 [Chloroflexi bacterium]|nr:hypothetical protein [Chloroflexota bacterium]